MSASDKENQPSKKSAAKRKKKRRSVPKNKEILDKETILQGSFVVLLNCDMQLMLCSFS